MHSWCGLPLRLTYRDVAGCSDPWISEGGAQRAIQRRMQDLAKLYQLLLCQLQAEDYGFDDCCSPRVPNLDPGELPGLHVASLCLQLQ